MAGEALISFEEAEQLATAKQKSPLIGSRTAMMAVTGVVAIGVLTLLIMTLLSLRGAKTGLSTILPFLDRTPPRTLQLN